MSCSIGNAFQAHSELTFGWSSAGWDSIDRAGHVLAAGATFNCTNCGGHVGVARFEEHQCQGGPSLNLLGTSTLQIQRDFFNCMWDIWIWILDGHDLFGQRRCHPATIAQRGSFLELDLLQASQVYDSVTAGLQEFYRTKLLPIEKDHLFHQFYSPELTDAEKHSEI